jgi:hypothetical protein
MLSIPLDQCLTYDPQQNLFFVNFERFSVRSHGEIRAIVRAVENKLAPLGRRVYAIVNYDNFSILPELLDEYSAAVRGLVDRFYSGVSRYTTSGFLRMKLGEALEKRGVAPHIFESAADAQSDFHNWRRARRSDHRRTTCFPGCRIGKSCCCLAAQAHGCLPAKPSHQPRYGNEYFRAAFKQPFSALSMSSSDALGQYSRHSSRFCQAASLASRPKSCRQRPRLSHNMHWL